MVRHGIVVVPALTMAQQATVEKETDTHTQRPPRTQTSPESVRASPNTGFGVTVGNRRAVVTR